MDLYRITSADELEDAGGVELMTSGGGISVIEWAEHAETALPNDTLRVVFEIIGPGERRLSITEPSV